MKLSFVLMREQLKDVYGAERFTVTGTDSNTIDCMYIPLAAPNSGSPSKGSAPDPHHTHHARSDFPGSRNSRGTVLFCAPNAGLYECIAMQPKDTTWVGFYQALGFEVSVYSIDFAVYDCSVHNAEATHYQDPYWVTPSALSSQCP